MWQEALISPLPRGRNKMLSLETGLGPQIPASKAQALATEIFCLSPNHSLLKDGVLVSW